jgi:ribonuclease E
MSNSTEPDDDWAELARELEQNAPAADPAPLDDEQPPDDAPADFAEADETGAAYEYDESDTGEAGDDAGEEVVADGEAAPGDGQPGTGRKRRRRRRRRRKGGQQPADASAEAPATDADEAEPQPVASFDDEVGEEEADEELIDDEDGVTVDSEVEAAEDAGGELLRDLIANWNVPSWDEIVGSLYRPER